MLCVAHHVVIANSVVAMLSQESSRGLAVFVFVVRRVDRDRMMRFVFNQVTLGHPECLDDVSSTMSSYFGGANVVFCVVEPFLECCCISGP